MSPPTARASLATLFVLLALLLPTSSHAQGCCAPGTSPLGGLASNFPAPGSVQGGIAFEYFDLDRELDPSKGGAAGERTSRIRRYVSYARVGLPSRLTLILEFPYEDRVRNQRFTTAGGNEVRLDHENRGPGDLSTLLMVRAMPAAPISPWALNVGIGAKWGTGPSEREGIPVEIQSGTGSHDLLVAGSAHRFWPLAAINAESVVRLPTRGRNRYEYGNEWNMAAALVVSPGAAWNAGLDLRFRSAGHDRFAGRTLPNTGGARWMAGPRLGLTVRSARLGAQAVYLLPLSQEVNGSQLGMGRQVVVGLRWPA